MAAEAHDFLKSFWQTTVTFDGGVSKVFKAARDEKAKLIFIQVSGEKTAYQVSKYYFDNMDKDDSYFTPEPTPPSPAPAK